MNKQKQQGGTLLGFIFGLIIGLGVALGVVMLINKNNSPFDIKNSHALADRGNHKVEDPNTSLYGKNFKLGEKVAAAKSSENTDDEESEVEEPIGPKDKKDVKSKVKEKDKKASEDTENAEDGDTVATTTSTKKEDKKKKQAAVSDEEEVTPVEDKKYFIQLGAFNDKTKAEAIKAQASLSGVSVKIETKEVNGKEMYRVRTDTFSDEDSAREASDALNKAKISNKLIPKKTIPQ